MMSFFKLKPTIALITPTGARPKQIELCAKFMSNQDYKGDVLWIIIDDAEPVTTDFITKDFKKDWTIVKVKPTQKWLPGMNTQSRNMMLGLDLLNKYEVGAIFVIEDDDYYSPRYLSEMMKQFKGYDVIGETDTIYYNTHYHTWYPNRNMKHVSLFQVAFTPKMIPLFRQSCLDRKGKFIDMCFFRRAVAGRYKLNLFKTAYLSIGIKGMKGRSGIGFGHRMSLNKMRPDPNLEKLKSLIGEDYKYYV